MHCRTAMRTFMWLCNHSMAKEHHQSKCWIFKVHHISFYFEKEIFLRCLYRSPQLSLVCWLSDPWPRMLPTWYRDSGQAPYLIHPQCLQHCLPLVHLWVPIFKRGNWGTRWPPLTFPKSSNPAFGLCSKSLEMPAPSLSAEVLCHFLAAAIINCLGLDGPKLQKFIISFLKTGSPKSSCWRTPPLKDMGGGPSLPHLFLPAILGFLCSDCISSVSPPQACAVFPLWLFSMIVTNLFIRFWVPHSNMTSP
jgi:hypothetical protein